MTELNFPAIVESLIELYSDKFDDWESSFMNNMSTAEFFTDKMKAKILQINRKYKCMR